MAAITRVYTLRRAAFILGRNEDLLWDLADSFEPEDGIIWIYDLDDDSAVMGLVLPHFVWSVRAFWGRSDTSLDSL